jgi:hypothetical protein
MIREHQARFMHGTSWLVIGEPPLPDSTAHALTALLPRS